MHCASGNFAKINIRISQFNLFYSGRNVDVTCTPVINSLTEFTLAIN